jgi:hypothetical protein
MVLIAFSLQAEVEKYGAYVGIAAFFGLALLSLLYFAQAREVKRLREWAGRAPERAAELEQAVLEHAEEVRHTPVPRAQPVRQAPAVAAASSNGVVKLKPEEVAALAFARAAGVREPHEPKAHPVAAVAAPPTEVAAAGAAVAAGEPAAAQALNGGNGGSRTVPRPATPAARRGEVPPPPPLPPRRASAAGGRRPAPAPEREGTSMFAVVLTAIVGVIVIGGAIFLFTRGGDSDAPPPKPNVQATTTPQAKATRAPSEPPAPTKETALIAVYNGTTQEGLAGTMKDQLAQDGFPDKNLGVDNTPPDQQRATSVVAYRRGSKSVATSVASTLGITAIQQFDDATESLIVNTGKKWNVVVVLGTDKTN